MFATLFSGEAPKKAARNIKHIFDHYWQLSGLQVNLHKSKNQFSKGVLM